jgi:hypothetical protein
VTAHPSRLQAINGRLARRVENLPLSPAAAAVALALAIQTSHAGVCWFQPSRLASITKRPVRVIVEAIKELADAARVHGVAPLLFYVRPEHGKLLPWPKNPKKDKSDPPPADAWAFWLPDAADAARLAAESLYWHIGACPAGWPVEGEKLSEFLAANPEQIANDQRADAARATAGGSPEKQGVSARAVG